MKLRAELEPQLEVARRRYAEIKRMLLDYTDYCDKHGDEEELEYHKLEDRLQTLTGKDMRQYNLWEWWEADGVEALAFAIALPEPVHIMSITRDELTELIKRIQAEDADEELAR